MAKFNQKTAPKTRVARRPDGVTYQGGPGYSRDLMSELFLLAVTNMVGEQTFYEQAGDRDQRYRELVGAAAIAHPQWTARFLRWLRGGANLRTASLVGAAEYVRARLAAGLVNGTGEHRRVVADVLQRADEPGELLAYWTSRYGRTVPKPVKRGVADAAVRLYTERNLLKYDTASHAFRFADVLDLTHPVAAGPAQGDLFTFALDRRHNRAEPRVAESLTMVAANAALRAGAAEDPSVLLDPQRLRAAGMTWEDALSLGGSRLPKNRLWEAMIPSMGYMACLAEGTPVWLADGTIAPIEDVVAKRSPVLSYDKAWDTRPVRYGPNQGSRDESVGKLVPTVPSAWLDAGVRPVASISFVSGRSIQATYDHRWVRQRRSGRQAWEWTTTTGLRVGDRIPVPLTADYFGDEGDAWDGYFIGAMLGDGGMTALTPEFHGDPHDGAVAFMREYAAKHGCKVDEAPNGTIVRLRFPFKQWRRNPVTELLRRYEVWGKRCEVKALPNRPFSREFWIGVLSGLIDTDGCVRERMNAKGTLHGAMEYATVSRRLAEQVSDALLRLGVANIVREKAARVRPADVIQSRLPIFIVEVNRATALVALSGLVDLRISYKAAILARLAERLSHVAPAASEMHGYDEAVALDRIAAIEDAGERATYCVTIDTSNLFVVNGVVTGNCLRNLRNFDQAGVSDAVAATVAAQLADPAEVTRSRQLPMRFLSAYRAAPSLRWAWALERALNLSLANIPELPGDTLILIDTSGSMNSVFSKDGTLRRWDAAVIFGLALALRCESSTVVSFSTRTTVFPVRRGESLLRGIDRFKTEGHFHNGGTNTASAVRAHYRKQQRVVILTDEQASYDGNVSETVPATVPLFTWNLAGYRMGHTPQTHNRWTFGGLTDASFTMIPLLENGDRGEWPF